MYKEVEGKEMFNHLKHLVVNDIGFSIVQVKTRRTQKISVIRWLTAEQTEELKEALEGDDGIILKSGGYPNVREALRAIKKEASTDRRLNMYMELKDHVIEMKKINKGAITCIK